MAYQLSALPLGHTGSPRAIKVCFFPFKTWSRSEYSFAYIVYFQDICLSIFCGPGSFKFIYPNSLEPYLPYDKLFFALVQRSQLTRRSSISRINQSILNTDSLLFFLLTSRQEPDSSAHLDKRGKQHQVNSNSLFDHHSPESLDRSF